LKDIQKILRTIATATTVAIVVFSCKSKLSEAQSLDLAKTPLQSVDSMYMIQSEKGRLQMRVSTPKLRRFETDTLSTEFFPDGIMVYAYNEEGDLETTIKARQASHVKDKRNNAETWKAFGDVRVRNIIKKETMETDTLYWDREKQEIYTDCYIRLYSPDGFMQGYGMRSDEKARNSIIHRPFNSYSVVVQDTTRVLVDSANFIGPLLRK